MASEPAAADPVDIGTLSASQQEALQMYTSVTDQEPTSAIPLLQRSEWNVQIAITKFFDGEGANPLEEAQRQMDAVPTQGRSSGVLMNDMQGSSIRYRRPAQRPGAVGLGGAGGRDDGWRPPLLLMILFSPFTLVFKILTGGITLIRDLWNGPPPPTQRSQRTVEDAPRQSAEQQARTDLRNEQESAYERSLAADREKARLKKEAETQKAKDEQKARDRDQWIRWRVSTIAAEPPTEDKSASRLSIRLRDGQRVVRRFAAATTMEELFAFVECQGVEETEKVPPMPESYVHEYGFRLVQTMPRAVYQPDSATVTQRVGRSAQLIVESIEEDDEEEE